MKTVKILDERDIAQAIAMWLDKGSPAWSVLATDLISFSTDDGVVAMVDQSNYTTWSKQDD